MFGGNFSGAAADIGTTGDDTLTGSAEIDRQVGGTGNDLLIGNGGADVQRGGAGDDVLAIGDSGFADLDGGTGTDTLRLDGADLTLDLRAIGAPSLSGIEVIDLGRSGNTLVLDNLNLQHLSQTSNTLRVIGDASDTVVLASANWSETFGLFDGGSRYDVFTAGDARIEILSSVTRLGTPLEPISAADIRPDTSEAGFAIYGIAANDRAGTGASSVGDVNGDGLDDVIIGVPYGLITSGSSDAAAFDRDPKPDTIASI